MSTLVRTDDLHAWLDAPRVPTDPFRRLVLPSQVNHYLAHGWTDTGEIVKLATDGQLVHVFVRDAHEPTQEQA